MESVKEGVNDSSTEDFLKLFAEINESVKSVKDNVTSLKSKILKKEIYTNNGLSLLEVKNQMLLSYLSNIIYIILRKCHGKSIAGDKAIDRLVEFRTVIERMQPIENKMKYQIDKLMKIAAMGTADEYDPTHFKANPENMIDDGVLSENNTSDESDDEANINESESKDGRKSDIIENKKKAGIYVPPKLVAVHYDGDVRESSKKDKLLERARRHALNSSVLQELREEYLDNPAEVTQSTSFKPKQSKFAKEKQEYEETYFTRISSSKKETHKTRNAFIGGNLKGLTDFEDISILDPNSSYTPDNKKRKAKPRSSTKKGFKNKRKKFH